MRGYQMKSRMYWAIGAIALAGASYAVLHDPQPTTHNGLVRIPTGDADIDAKNALEDARNAFQLHEEARIDGDFAKARFYQEAAEAAFSIGNRASAQVTSELLGESNSIPASSTDDLDELERAADDAISAVGSSAPSIESAADPQMLGHLRNAAESLELSCRSYGTNCQAAEISRRQYEDALVGR
ncbi:hypothetical protein [Pontixanthobacter sp. CEM42]|uniref:hypothetical protein n=1 Tax=Pontixanthobacter sp. CEM42 TaxID=2792077 RepID=UPI001AE01F1F|nr:hypothetical protein [Pontixanthobacter sp. CEM42]